MLSQIAKRTFSSSAARANVARFTAIGRIGTDLEVSQAASGRPYLRYALAVNGPKEHTSWYNVVVFDEHAIDALTNYYQKGSHVYVEADASINTYGEEENRRSTLNLVQRDIRKVGSGRRPGSAEATEESA